MRNWQTSRGRYSRNSPPAFLCRLCPAQPRGLIHFKARVNDAPRVEQAGAIQRFCTYVPDDRDLTPSPQPSPAHRVPPPSCSGGCPSLLPAARTGQSWSPHQDLQGPRYRGAPQELSESLDSEDQPLGAGEGCRVGALRETDWPSRGCWDCVEGAVPRRPGLVAPGGQGQWSAGSATQGGLCFC